MTEELRMPYRKKFGRSDLRHRSIIRRDGTADNDYKEQYIGRDKKEKSGDLIPIGISYTEH